jgi:hypothetical protein
MFWRSLRLFDGIAMLLNGDLPEEAMILGRGLFEEALRLAEVANSGDKRAALLIGWEAKSLNEKIGLHNTAIAMGLDPLWGHDLGPASKLIRKVLAAYQHAHDIKKTRAFQDVKTGNAKIWSRARFLDIRAIARDGPFGVTKGGAKGRC